jgi:hypothetical protein
MEVNNTRNKIASPKRKKQKAYDKVVEKRDKLKSKLKQKGINNEEGD